MRETMKALQAGDTAGAQKHTIYTKCLKLQDTKLLENSVPNALPYYSASRQPPSLPYPPSGYPDLTNDYRDAINYSKEKEEIHGMYEGDIAD
jgi:hypothetical protein